LIKNPLFLIISHNIYRNSKKDPKFPCMRSRCRNTWSSCTSLETEYS